MTCEKLLALLLAAAFGLPGCATQGDARLASPSLRSGYAQVDDIRMYYESRGTGEAIVMLHGGFGTAALWGECAERLAGRYRVVTPDARGRGRTNDGSGPLTGGRTARDVIALMDQLGIARAHLVGHSAGSLTVIHALVDHPERVLSATLVGSPMMALRRPGDALRTLEANMEALGRGQSVNDADLTAFAARWRAAAPQPERFAAMMEKMARGVRATYGESALRSITRPVLVVKAGRDNLIEAADFERLAAAIPGAQLADFPDGTHGLPRQAAPRLAEAIERFIESQPKRP